MGHLYCVALVVSIFSTLTVSRAEKPLFVRTGDAVRLDVQGYEGFKFDSITWLVNTTNILRYIITGDIATKFGIYTNRVEFEKRNFTLLLKNAQQNDSGIYTARRTDNLGNEKVAATYRLTVQEPVPKPQMTVAILSSPGRFCHVSVNCSAVDTWASYTCNHTHCTQVMNTTSPTGVSLIVTAANGTIQCNSSNFVSTAMKTESIEDIFSRAEKSLFVRTGDAVRLDMQGYEGLKFDSITWLVNTTKILRYIIIDDIARKFGIYTNRVEFEKRNFSLLLKNAQQNDSGIYTARRTDDLGNEKVAATYRLTVQGPQEDIREGMSDSIIIIIGVTCFICIFLISIIITVIYRRKRHNQGTQEDTNINAEYANVQAVGLQNLSAVETTYHNVTPAKPDRPLEVNTVYDTMGPPGDNSEKPETNYVTVI